MRKNVIRLTLCAMLFALSFSVQAQQPRLGSFDGEGLPSTDIDRVQVGEVAPDFRLTDERGTIHQLSQYRGQKNVVLVVYRGYW
jgi:cytochrome oxidase Cu insertion factor (SCO1/SenC/PrrC family)